MSRVLVYTAITSGYDSPRPLHVGREDGVSYWMFSKDAAKGWDSQIIPEGMDQNPLRRARELKVLVPNLFPIFDAYLWMDGTMQLKAKVLPWVERLMESGAEMAAFRHPEWSCAYREIEACIDRGKDDKVSLKSAKRLLKGSRHPRDYGQIATGFLWRRSSPLVRQHAREWWQAMGVSTMRDQCTVMSAAREVGLEVEYLPGLHTRNKLVHYRRGHQK